MHSNQTFHLKPHTLQARYWVNESRSKHASTTFAMVALVKCHDFLQTPFCYIHSTGNTQERAVPEKSVFLTTWLPSFFLTLWEHCNKSKTFRNTLWRTTQSSKFAEELLGSFKWKDRSRHLEQHDSRGAHAVPKPDLGEYFTYERLKKIKMPCFSFLAWLNLRSAHYSLFKLQKTRLLNMSKIYKNKLWKIFWLIYKHSIWFIWQEFSKDIVHVHISFSVFFVQAR